MATSTIQLARTIARSSQYARLEPLLFAANTYNDPAFSNADWVKQTILAPPFAWRWNRTSQGTPSAPAFATIIVEHGLQGKSSKFRVAGKGRSL